MKAVLNLELFGEDTRAYLRIAQSIFALNGAKAIFDQHIGIPHRSSWVAEIVGPDEKYGLARNFLRAKLDYSRSNSKGSRGIFSEYILETGKIYEVKSQESWSKSNRYFCVVSDDGDIAKISEETACHAVGALTYDERREKRRVEKISGNQRA